MKMSRSNDFQTLGQTVIKGITTPEFGELGNARVFILKCKAI